MDQLIALTVKQVKNCHLIEPQYDLDNNMISDFKYELTEILESGDVKRVCMDLNKVSHIDSSGLGFLLNIQFKFRNIIYFRFTNVGEAVYKTMEITNLLQHFAFDDSLTESLSKLEDQKYSHAF